VWLQDWGRSEARSGRQSSTCRDAAASPSNVVRCNCGSRATSAHTGLQAEAARLATRDAMYCACTVYVPRVRAVCPMSRPRRPGRSVRRRAGAAEVRDASRKVDGAAHLLRGGHWWKGEGCMSQLTRLENRRGLRECPQLCARSSLTGSASERLAGSSQLPGMESPFTDSGSAASRLAVRVLHCHCKRRRDRRDSAETRVAEAASAPCSSRPLSLSAANKVQPLTVVDIRFAFSGRPPQTSTHRAPSDPAFALAHLFRFEPALPAGTAAFTHTHGKAEVRTAAALISQPRACPPSASAPAVGSAVRPSATALPCIPARPLCSKRSFPFRFNPSVAPTSFHLPQPQRLTSCELVTDAGQSS
jgi:hypothetical protein